jgi:hypothetical protein
MSSRAITCSSLHLHRSRIFFLTRTTQHVRRATTLAPPRAMILVEVGRALLALATLAAWMVVIALFS